MHLCTLNYPIILPVNQGLLLPLLIVVFPVLGFDVVGHETFHQLILIVAIPSAIIALGMRHACHRSRVAAGLGLAGIAALVIAARY